MADQVPSFSVSSRLAQSLVPAGQALLRLVYPPRCAGCGASLLDEQDPLCPRCIQRLERVESAQIDGLLARLPEARSAFDGAFALWHFDTGGTVQRVQHLLKYGNRPRVGLALGRLMGAAYQATSTPLPDLIAPLPLHRTRHFERGYNQSAMLARGFSETLQAPVSGHLLERRRPTRSQTNLSRRQRWTNVADAFAVMQPEILAGRCVLLIDDVLTTGATLAAAALTLREAGVASVYAATLALARG